MSTAFAGSTHTTIKMQVVIPRFQMSGRRTSSSSDKDKFIQRYRRLSEQSDSIRQRLNSISSEQSYESYSPTDMFSSTPSPHQPFSQSYHYQPASSYPMAPTWPQSHSVATSNSSEVNGEASLYEINQQIKTTLTELLNCDSVKHDKIFRAWVQTKLMDAEHQLKRQRKRRSSASEETMKAFEHNCGGHSASGFCWRSSF